MLHKWANSWFVLLLTVPGDVVFPRVVVAVVVEIIVVVGADNVDIGKPQFTPQ